MTSVGTAEDSTTSGATVVSIGISISYIFYIEKKYSCPVWTVDFEFGIVVVIDTVGIFGPVGPFSIGVLDLATIAADFGLVVLGIVGLVVATGLATDLVLEWMCLATGLATDLVLEWMCLVTGLATDLVLEWMCLATDLVTGLVLEWVCLATDLALEWLCLVGTGPVTDLVLE